MLKLTPADFGSYCRLREALDALRDAALVQYALCDTVDARKTFSAAVEGGVDKFLGDIIKTPENRKAWKDHQNQDLITELSSASAGCPPGFVESGGRCVRIPGTTT